MPELLEGTYRDRAGKGGRAGLHRSLENHAKESTGDHITWAELWFRVG